MTKAKTQICTACKTEKSIRKFNGYRNSKEIGGWNYDVICRTCSPNKRCIECNERKPFKEFRAHNRKGKTVYGAICQKCENSKNKQRLKERYEKKGYQEFLNRYHGDPEFRRKSLKRSQEWEKKNLEHRREYRSTAEQRKTINAWFRKKRRQDPKFKLRQYWSGRIYRTLIKHSKGKFGKSIINYLPYTMAELKQHIENQFEPWMNWDNHGRYESKTWNDNDSSTWTWQIDHIIPHSELPYDSMEHPNFKKAWALKNLRPLNSKQNLFDGVRKTRHNAI